MAHLALHGKSEMVQLKAVEVLNKMEGYSTLIACSYAGGELARLVWCGIRTQRQRCNGPTRK